MVRSALSRHLGQRHGCDDWTNHDAWFRTRMLDLFVGLDASDAEKMSRFILSLLLAAPGEIDYARERELFKYNKLRFVIKSNYFFNLFLNKPKLENTRAHQSRLCRWQAPAARRNRGALRIDRRRRLLGHFDPRTRPVD